MYHAYSFVIPVTIILQYIICIKFKKGNTSIAFSCAQVCLQCDSLPRGVLGHFEGQRPWAPIEDVVNQQSGVLVGKFMIMTVYVCMFI